MHMSSSANADHVDNRAVNEIGGRSREQATGEGRFDYNPMTTVQNTDRRSLQPRKPEQITSSKYEL